MASTSTPANDPSCSRSRSDEIDVLEDPETKLLLDEPQAQVDDDGNSNSGTSASAGSDNSSNSKMKSVVSRIWKWLRIPFNRTDSLAIQPDLENKSVALHVHQTAAVLLPQEPPLPRDNNIWRWIVPMSRSIRRCIVGRVIRFSSVLSLSDPVSATLMGYMSTAAVMGILTLNIYSASYFLAWRKEGSHCHFLPGSKTSTPDSAPDSKISDKTDTLVQLIVVSLHFAGFPIAFFIGALSKAAQKKTRFLGCVVGLVICEIIYILVLGGIMTICMSNVSGISFGCCDCYIFFSSRVVH